jgi:hypothetical protein
MTRIKFACLILGLCVIFNTKAYNQKILTTPLGQIIQLDNNGSWKYPDKSVTEDAEGMMILDADPKIAPTKEKYSMDERHNQGLKVLTDTILKREIKHYLEYIHFNFQVDLMRSHYQLLQQQAELERAKLYMDSINIYKKLASNNQKELNQLIVSYKKAQKLRDIEPKNRNEYLKKLGRTLDMDMSNYMVTLLKKQNHTSNTFVSDTKVDFTIIPSCTLDTIFAKSVEKSKAIDYRYWFSYTPTKMKSYFKSRNLLQGYVSVVVIEGKEYLRLLTVISSKDAAKNYGGVAEGNFMKIVFVTGKTINLRVKENSKEFLENYTGNVSFETLFILDKDNKDILEKIPIDTIGVMWSSGFEVYPIYEVDAIIHSLECLKNL